MAKDQKKPSTALTVAASETQIAALTSDFPVEPGFQRRQFPRINYRSQDITEEERVGGKKQLKVVVEAGTFFLEKPEVDEDGNAVLDEETKKPKWSSEELGQDIEGTIVFYRKQLRYYDEATNSYTSSPVYDTENDVVPLFRDGAEIDRGTPKELMGREEYASVSKKTGKPVSLLEETRVLYVLYAGELYTLPLRGSSKYAFLSYTRKARPSVPSVITHFSSEPKENGGIKWNQMTFDVVRTVSAKEAEIVREVQDDLKNSIIEEKGFFAAKEAADPHAEERRQADKEFREYKGRGE